MTAEELIHDTAFTKIAEVQHSEMKRFLIPEIEQQPVWAKIGNMYQIGGFLALIIGTFKAFLPLFAGKEVDNLWWLGGGILFSFSLLIVMHELTHALAYKVVGAKKLSFGMILRKFIFYVQADKQVFDYHKFRIVALAPAVVIGIITLAGMIIFYNQHLFYFFLAIFGLHSIFCGGDFGLLCFFENRKNDEILTFDDKEKGLTYFYSKNNH
jgi:hypothetical protein